jgi:hypothetical protein
VSRRALIVIALLATTAHAERWRASYAYGGDVETIGGDGYAGGMLQIQVSRSLMYRLSASLTAELASVSSEGIEGAIARALVGVDYQIVRGAGMFAADLYAIGGSGAETIMWDRGTLTRPMSYAGAEVRTRFTLGHSDFFRNITSLGFRFGVRAHVAPGTSSENVAKLCTACTQMEPADPTIDVGVAIYMGLVFGR